MESPVRIALIGAKGRMGQAIVDAAGPESGVIISASCERGDAIAPAARDTDVVVDFSHSDATETICAACVAEKKPLVIGTTGHSPDQCATMRRAATVVPIVLAPNFSVGVNALFFLARKTAELLEDGFDVEIIETHHRLKRDAPSGTAKRLGEIVTAARGWTGGDVVHGREGMVGARPAQQIGMHSVRAGDVIGEHTVVFAGAGERLELTHKASSRETFAVGALRAARWIVHREPGLYTMEDVLGLDRPR